MERQPAGGGLPEHLPARDLTGMPVGILSHLSVPLTLHIRLCLWDDKLLLQFA